LLPAVIERLSRKHPGVTVHVVQMHRPITLDVQQLRARSVDLIVGRGVFPIPEDDVSVDVLFEEPLLVVAGASSRWAQRRKLALAEIVNAKWISYPPDGAPGVLVDEAFRTLGLAVPRPSVTTSSFHLREALLGTADYLTVIPECMLRVFNARRVAVKSLPIDLGVRMRPVAIFTLKNRTLSPVAELVIKCIRSVGSSMGSQPGRRGG
jgi:DNA-binding transcriptional LysR family regulator